MLSFGVNIGEQQVINDNIISISIDSGNCSPVVSVNMDDLHRVRKN